MTTKETKKPEAHGITEKTNVSVVQMVKDMPKFVVQIARTDDKNAVDPVFISNGDYQVTLKRGAAVVVPEAIVTALQDAVIGVMDPETKQFTEVPSYPYSATPYKGTEPIGTVVDQNSHRPIVKH